MREIVQQNAPVLRQQANAVSLSDIGTTQLRAILDDMIRALDAEEDGVAIAAPQIGVPLRIFIVSGKAFAKDLPPEAPLPPHRVFINPEIVNTSKQRSWLEEGCLSVRWTYGEVHRFKKATVHAFDENGKEFTLGGSGLLAQIFQHEIDHLDGVLFIDSARNVRDIPPEERP